MTRIPRRSPRGAGLLVRAVYRAVRRRFGRVPASVQLMAHNGWVLAAASAFELAFGRARALDARLKELASLKAATVVGCRFCIDIGTALARSTGVSEEEIRDVPVHETSSRFTALEKRVLDYAVAMTECPMQVTDELFGDLHEQLGNAAMVELTAIIAWENYRARFNHAFGATEEGFSEGMVCLLPPEGPGLDTAAQTPEPSPDRGEARLGS